MAEVSITQQIKEKFIERLSEEASIDASLKESIKRVINSEKKNKEDLLALLKGEAPNHENPRT